jgi:C_GCAxxG_C_C family probable redox protein
VAIAVGDHCFGEVPEVLLRASGPLAGGGGSCYEEMCGILSGGMMMLGALLGRTLPTEDDEAIFALAREYRDRFRALAQHTQCQAIRDTLPEKEKRCEPIVVAAVRILVEMLETRGVQPQA